MTLEQFKNHLAAKIQQKEIGLVMLVDRRGRILWHHGRKVTGRTVQEGSGFSGTHLCQVIDSGAPLATGDVMISRDTDAMPASASMLFVRSLLIHPVDNDVVLYADSGNDVFGPEEIALFAENSNALRELLAELKGVHGGVGGICGESPHSVELQNLALAFAIEDDPVLILGETGVGKSHLAQLIHRFSGRTGSLINVDIPTVPESLFESELFGHAKGAFTGAETAKKGLIEAAESGTIFLDEIAEMPMALQSKLLRFIDNAQYRPVGETAERTTYARVIAATNRNLQEEVSARRFREDLLYRLDVLTLEIKPLRERPEDIRALVGEHQRFLRGKELSQGFWDVALTYSWPGNVRELINVMKRAGIQLDGPVIGAEIADLLRSNPAFTQSESSFSVREMLATIDSGASFWDSAWVAFLDREINRPQLRSFLQGLFRESRHSLKTLASRLNIDDQDYSRFVSALHKYRVHPGQDA